MNFPLILQSQYRKFCFSLPAHYQVTVSVFRPVINLVLLFRTTLTGICILNYNP